MKKKINLMYIAFSLGVGGIETLILELCKKLDSQKYLPMVCVFEHGGKLQNEFEKAVIPIYIIKKRHGIDWTLPMKLSRLFKQLKIDIVHTHNQGSWLYGGIATRLTNLPLVHTEHNTGDYHNYHSQRWMKIEWVLSKITNQITTVAGSLANFMIEKEGISPTKIRVVYNGIKPEIYDCQIDKQLKKNELNIEDSDLIVGNVARFFPIKDHKALLKAFKIVIQRIPSAKLLLAGDGPLKNELLQMTEELNLNEKVRFLGNRRDIPDLLKVFDLFVLSSIKEGFPIVLLEAMASGLPVVATNVGGNPELAIHGETGFIVPPRNPEAMADAICRLLLNREEAKCMGERGRERVKQYFSFEKMIREYENIYDSMYSSGRK